jgi:hypothetical protein
VRAVLAPRVMALVQLIRETSFCRATGPPRRCPVRLRSRSHGRQNLTDERRLDVMELIKTDGEEVSDPTLAGFREEFDEYLSSSERVTRVVILVDHLDRCLQWRARHSVRDWLATMTSRPELSNATDP